MRMQRMNKPSIQVVHQPRMIPQASPSASLHGVQLMTWPVAITAPDTRVPQELRYQNNLCQHWHQHQQPPHNLLLPPDPTMLHRTRRCRQPCHGRLPRLCRPHTSCSRWMAPHTMDATRCSTDRHFCPTQYYDTPVIAWNEFRFSTATIQRSRLKHMC